MRTLLLIPVLFAVACSTPTKDKVDIPALKAEVIAIHDEVMPKMGELRSVSKALTQAAIADTTKAEWAMVAEEISDANASMMTWMRGFEPNFEGTEEEIVAYLQDQKQKVEQVKESMNSSLAKGKSLLEQ